MKLKVPKKNYSVTELYDTVATEMGYSDVSRLHYDCREITVAPNIQDGFFEHYREIAPHLSESDLQMGVAMLLLDRGPKVDESLADNEVEVFDNFIC